MGPPARRYLSRRRVREVAASVPASPALRALDVGCSWGLALAVLNRRGATAFGCDLVPDDFAAGRRVADANGLPFRAVVADAASLPFKDGVFDAVTSVETMEHVFAPDRPRTAAEMARVLKPGGFLSLSTPNYGALTERVKRLALRFPALRRLLPFTQLPATDTPRRAYHPHTYHNPLRLSELTALLASAGFTVGPPRPILFMYKYCPAWLFPLARGGMARRAVSRRPVVGEHFTFEGAAGLK